MPRAKVFVSQRIFPEAVHVLREAGLEVETHQGTVPLPKLQLVEKLREADGLVCLLTDRVDAEVLEGAPRLKVVANVAAGYDNIDVEAATARGILVTNTPGVLTETTADLAFGLLLAAARRIPEADRFTRTGRFRGWELFQPHLGFDVWGKTLGIVGFGQIGQAVARRAQGFRMRVLYHQRRRLALPRERELGAQYVSFDDLLRESAFISIHTPLTPETYHLFSREEFRKMKPTAILVNTARGPVVDEAALVEALRKGWIRGAALDVYEEEPRVHPGLLEQEAHVVLVPHIGSATHETRRRMAVLAAENLAAALRGERPPNLVNPEAWERRTR